MLMDTQIAAFRRFNRFYTKELGLLRRNFLGSPWSLGEMRVLYEVWMRPGLLAKEIAEELDIDAAYLSRLISRFEKQDIVRREPSDRDARELHLFLTANGLRQVEETDAVQKSAVSRVLEGLSEDEQVELTSAMQRIETLIETSRQKNVEH